MTLFKIKYYFGSLKTTLLLTVAFLVFLTGFAVSQLVIGHYSSSLLSGVIARAENIAHGLALEVTDMLLVNDLVSVQKMFDDQLKSESSIAYLFVLNNGKVLVHTFSDGIPVNLVNLNPPGTDTHATVVKFISQENKHYIDIGWPIFEGRSGTLRMGIMEAPYRDKVSHLKLKMTLITLGVLVVALIISYFLIRHLFYPLSTLTQTVKRIDKGNLDERIEVKGRAEVTRLARAYNAMLDRIRDYTTRLKEYTLRLERKHKELDRAHSQLVTTFSISRKINAHQPFSCEDTDFPGGVPQPCHGTF